MTLLALGLVCALFGAPALLLASRRFGSGPFDLVSRLGLWCLAAGVVFIAGLSAADGYGALGLSGQLGHGVLAGVSGALLVLAVWPLLGALQRRLGAGATEQSAMFQSLAARSFPYRVFLVVTAGVTEEILYRGYGIGVGRLLLGGTVTASMVSLGVFVAAHLRWGAGHLLSVLWAGAVLSALFVYTGSLVACIVAHVVVDAAGLLLAPWALALRARRSRRVSGGDGGDT